MKKQNNTSYRMNHNSSSMNVATLYAIIGVAVVVGIILLTIAEKIFASESWMILLTTLAGN